MKGMVTAPKRTAARFWVIRRTLAAPKRRASWAERAKALTTRTPARFSCITVFRLSSRRCTSPNMGKVRPMIQITSPSTMGTSTR